MAGHPNVILPGQEKFERDSTPANRHCLLAAVNIQRFQTRPQGIQKSSVFIRSTDRHTQAIAQSWVRTVHQFDENAVLTQPVMKRMRTPVWNPEQQEIRC